MNGIPFKNVPYDFMSTYKAVGILDVSNQDGYKTDVVEDFLRAFCLEARSSAITLHHIAAALRDGKPPIVIAALAEFHACQLDEKNLRFREAMNSLSFIMEYFDDPGAA